MRKDYNGDFVREDVLRIFQSNVRDKAEECNIEIRLIGGLLKFTPIGVYTRILLELEQPNFKNVAIIYKHRSTRLTSEHKGKTVSGKWVVGFLEHNANEAMRLIEEKKQSDDLKVKSNGIERPPATKPPPQPKEETNYGYSAGKSICPVCNGDGGATGQCYKCGGSGWA